MGVGEQDWTPLECKKCGHKWHPRGKKPVQCPRCKTYKWEG